MSDAQQMAMEMQCCGVELQHEEGVGLICPKCGRIAEPDDTLPEPTPDTDADEAQQVTGGAPYREAVHLGGRNTTDVQLPDEPREMVPRTPHPNDPITRNLPPLVVSKPLTPDEITNRIAECIARLDAGAEYHRAVLEEYEVASLKFDLAWARALSASDAGAADQRKADATIACEAELTRKHVAEMHSKAVAATMHDLRSALNGYQSISKAVGATYQNANYYGNQGYNNARGRAF